MTYITALVLTIIFETLTIFLLGLRNKKLFLNVILVNIITNPALNILLRYTQDYFKEIYFIYVIFLEITVVIIEWLFLKFRLKELKLPFFLISFTINSVSFLSGLWIYELFREIL